MATGIKIGDTNYQLDFSQPKYWSYLGQNTKLANLGPELWTYGRSGDIGSSKYGSFNYLSNFFCSFVNFCNKMIKEINWGYYFKSGVLFRYKCCYILKLLITMLMKKAYIVLY